MSKSPSLRRIQADIRELALDPSDRYHAAPLEDDMFEWHFTIRGADGTDFEGGVYHGRILLPPEYPFKPPHIVFLTPSGRFETGTKVCLSFSAYHPELWQPAWGIRLILEALISFLPTPADGAIGALDWKPEERKRLAKSSVSYCCRRCGNVVALLPQKKTERETRPRFEKEIEQLRLLQISNEAKRQTEGVDAVTEPATTEEAEPALIHDDDKKVEKVSQNGIEPIEKEELDAIENIVDDTETERQVETPLIEINGESTDTLNAVVQQDGEVDTSWLTDPLLHTTIVILAIICFLLVRKAMALVEDIRNLDSR